MLSDGFSEKHDPGNNHGKPKQQQCTIEPVELQLQEGLIPFHRVKYQKKRKYGKKPGGRQDQSGKGIVQAFPCLLPVLPTQPDTQAIRQQNQEKQDKHGQFGF